MKIDGGYYIKARCIQNSDISTAPPHVREIWDWIIKEANHKDTRVCKRGQLVRSYKDVQEGLCWYVGWRKMTYKNHQCEIAMKWLKKAGMITTKKTTRGMLINIDKYDYYQDPSNYESHKETRKKATRKPQTSHTINKNEKNEKKEEVYTSNESKIFSYFKDLKVDNEKIVSLGKEFDVRPKDVVWCIRDMIGKSDEKGLEIKNVRAKLKTWINNSIRWHKVATLTQKEQTKPKPRLTEDDKLALEILKIREERKNAKTT